MVDLKQLQKEIYQNKINKGFNTTDINQEFCYIYGETSEAHYYEEDIYITGKLKDYFDVVLCNLKNSESFEKDVDLIVFRNTGGVSGFKDIYNSFVD